MKEKLDRNKKKPVLSLLNKKFGLIKTDSYAELRAVWMVFFATLCG